MEQCRIEKFIQLQFGNDATKEDWTFPYATNYAEVITLLEKCKVGPLTGCWLYNPSKLKEDNNSNSPIQKVAEWKYGNIKRLSHHPIVPSVDKFIVRHNPLRCKLLRSRTCCRPSHLKWSTSRQIQTDRRFRKLIETDKEYRKLGEYVQKEIDRIAQRVIESKQFKSILKKEEDEDDDEEDELMYEDDYNGKDHKKGEEEEISIS
jgi:hypothetical protein